VALWVIAGLAFLVAAGALASTRRLSRRLDAMTQSYWELRYDYTRLRSQVSRLDPDQVEEAAAAEVTPAASTVSFVPLSSMRKKPEA
jgi:hypothetical protein